MGVVAIFMYVGAEVSIGSFLINFLGEADVAGLAPEVAAHYVGLYWAGAMVGRFIGVAVMSRFNSGRVLAAHGVGAIVLTLMAVFSHSMFAMWAILAVGLMNSIMFPTIFSMALHKLGSRTSEASGILCMGIVGGDVIPFAQGMFADAFDLRLSFIVPALCYGFVAYYGWRFADIYRR